MALVVILALQMPKVVATSATPKGAASCVPFPCSIVTQAEPDGSLVVVAKLQTSISTKIGSVTLVISPLTLSDGKYHNTQTTTVESTTGSLMNGVAVTMYENAGKSGGYFHGVTGPSKYPNGETIEHDTYPGAGSYTEWSSATWNGQTVVSVKITVVVP